MAHETRKPSWKDLPHDFSHLVLRRQRRLRRHWHAAVRSYQMMPRLAAVLLPELAELHHQHAIQGSIFIDKMAASSAPDAPGCILAVLIHGKDRSITFCRPGPGSRGSSCQASLPADIRGIAFSQGKFYALTKDEGLFAIAIDDERERQQPAVSSVTRLIDDTSFSPNFRLQHGSNNAVYSCRRRWYLVESRGRLLMVRRLLVGASGDVTYNLKVFRLDEYDGGAGAWTELAKQGLDGEALLVGKRGSVSVPAWWCVGAQEDCVYVFHDLATTWWKSAADDPFRDAGVYSVRDRKIISRLPPARRTASPLGRWFPTWLYPSAAAYVRNS
ncbi:hypothetical protein BRADI_1g14542v3 [Brachypodium distachyon]|uniref:KIB1-4 beta-propeller domain-containing protein n=1 Tax=Brachypodium distachyon TaxID=15368 RepID=A0A2K2DJH4_BRADI|nr:hypothetical protein BRADI_1g14542v3 [Brachypodium distachyon]